MKLGLVLDASLQKPGGVQEYVLGLQQYLARTGHEAVIVSPEVLGGTSIELLKLDSASSMPLTWAKGEEIEEYLRRERFDLLHFQGPFGVFSLQVLSRSEGPNVASFHIVSESTLLPILVKPVLPLFKGFVEKLDGKIAGSEISAAFMQEFFPGDYEVIPYGIDLGRFGRHIEPLPQYQDGRLNLLFLGRLDERKGLMHLLKAYRRLKPRLPEARLIVVGDGPKKKEGLNFVADYGLEDVEFSGYVASELIPHYYASADVYCAPATKDESFGIVLLEAMASGLPIVAFDNEGYRSVMPEEGRGFLVANKNIGALYQALLILGRNPGMREELSAWSLAQAQQYSWERVGPRVLDYYLRIVNQRLPA